jgi:hypothetical protein
MAMAMIHWRFGARHFTKLHQNPNMYFAFNGRLA